MAAPGVNGKLLVALSRIGKTEPAALIKQLTDHAEHVVQCNVLECNPVANPSAPKMCDALMTT